MKTYTQVQLKEILDKHSIWLQDNNKGERADLYHADLSYANLSYANLSYANLYNANLYNAYLSHANLSQATLYHANLSNSNLSKADLSYAYLSNANLYYADLFHANLSKADLSHADLSHADLSNANLSNARGIYSFNLGKHQAVAWKNKDVLMIKIGCKELSATDWIEKGREIGEKEGYSDEEIEIHGRVINALLWLPAAL